MAPSSTQKQLVQKWGDGLRQGWTAVPTLMLDLPKLDLRPLTFSVLVQLVSFWWSHDQRPFPSRALLARRLGVSVRSIHRALDELEDRGLIERLKRHRNDGGRASTEYDLSGLVEQLAQLADEDKEASTAA